MHPLILVIVVIALLVFVSWLKRAPPAQRNKAIFVAAIGAIVLLLASGKMNPLMAVIAGAAAIFQRVLSATQILDKLKSFGGGRSPDGASEVRTDFLLMRLNHETGEMDGDVLKGRLAGRQLSELGVADLGALYVECSHADAKSVKLMEGYLQRRLGPDWRGQFGGASGAPGLSGDMTREQAFEILGLAPDAEREEIIQAHRRLMQRNHPDRGGSTYLAAQINQAKDLLLG